MNNESIILQQLRLEFGDEFDELYANTRSYVKGLISKPWWVDRGALVSSEGPLSRMVEDAMSFIIEAKDKHEGWAAYTSYLSKFYGSTGADAKSIQRRVEYNPNDITWSTLGSYNGPSSFWEDVPIEKFVGHLVDEDQQNELYTIDKLGPTAAAEVLGVTPTKALDRRRTMRRTALRRAAKLSSK